MRDKSEKELKKSVFKRASKLGKDLSCENFELSTPQIIKRQLHRDNLIQVTTVEQHHRITLFSEFLGHVCY